MRATILTFFVTQLRIVIYFNLYFIFYFKDNIERFMNIVT